MDLIYFEIQYQTEYPAQTKFLCYKMKKRIII